MSSVNVTNGSGSSYRSIDLQLTMIDPTTRATLWAVQVPVRGVARKKKLELALQDAVDNLTSRLKVLVGESLTPRESNSLTQSTVDHSTRNFVILASALTGAALAGSLVLYHVYNVHKNDLPPALTCANNPIFCGH